MGTMRDGATDLGLELNWKYAFTGPGTALQPMLDAVLLDVGGQLAPGALDQHSDVSLGESTSQLVVHYPELVYQHLMGPWLQRRDNGVNLTGRAWSPRLVTHVDPDLDAVVSMLLVKHLIESGDLPWWGPAISEYVASVDQGRITSAGLSDLNDAVAVAAALRPLHVAFLALQNVTVPPGVGDRNTWRAMRGLALIEGEVNSLLESLGPHGRLSAASFVDTKTESSGVGAWRTKPEFADVKALVNADIDHHRQDTLEREAERFSCLLPAADGGDPMEVNAVWMASPPQAKLHKYWYRARDIPFTVTPLGTSNLVYHRVILSVDAAWRSHDGRRPHLRGLGARLEEAEHGARERNRAAGGDTRPKIPRWPDGSVDNNDPWYDGRGHHHTIIDTPRDGTVIPYSDILQQLKGWIPLAKPDETAQPNRAVLPFWETRLAEASFFVLQEIPGSGSEPSDVATGINRPGLAGITQLSPEMLAWAEKVHLASDAKDWPQASALLTLAGAGVRCDIAHFPPNTSPSFRVVHGTLPANATLESFGAATASISDAWVFLEYRTQGPESCDLDMVEAAAVRGRVRDVGSFADGRLRVHARALVLRRPPALANSAAPSSASRSATAHEDSAVLTTCLLYVAFLNRGLAGYALRVLDVIGRQGVSRRGGQATARHVAQDFLAFQAEYYQVDFSHRPEIGTVFAALREETQVHACYQEVQDELNRLAEHEQRRAEERLQVLLFIVGLAGVIQTVAAATDILVVESKQASSLICGSVIAVVLCAVGYGISRRRQHLSNIVSARQAADR